MKEECGCQTSDYSYCNIRGMSKTNGAQLWHVLISIGSISDISIHRELWCDEVWQEPLIQHSGRYCSYLYGQDWEGPSHKQTLNHWTVQHLVPSLFKMMVSSGCFAVRQRILFLNPCWVASEGLIPSFWSLNQVNPALEPLRCSGKKETVARAAKQCGGSFFGIHILPAGSSETSRKN